MSLSRAGLVGVGLVVHRRGLQRSDVRALQAGLVQGHTEACACVRVCFRQCVYVCVFDKFVYIRQVCVFVGVQQVHCNKISELASKLASTWSIGEVDEAVLGEGLVGEQAAEVGHNLVGLGAQV